MTCLWDYYNAPPPPDLNIVVMTYRGVYIRPILREERRNSEFAAQARTAGKK